MSNNCILSIIFTAVVLLGIYKQNNADQHQVVLVQIEQVGKQMLATNKGNWHFLTVLKTIQVHVVKDTERAGHQCFDAGSFQLTSAGVAMRYCCVKRLMSILFAALFIFIMYNYCDGMPQSYHQTAFHKSILRFFTGRHFSQNLK